ncbi:TlyA family RNA methyltransferase [Terriglobus aquaticus]|uniref:TlyA family RNA methyltransferase n=1 Tax=Terriglobus aquaticus TaxID=940139 RepID=A0ABW9KLW9_9BACT|nr:TlyA family RNA methyltransferase [Terriglobus aquaticus]
MPATDGFVRLDKLLVDRGLVASRERASAMVLAGRVLVNEQKVTKAGTAIAVDSALRLLGDDIPFVSRGGLKLQGALDHWKLSLTGRGAVDIGASTGGFTDCMLQRGAAAVVAVDTGYGQMAVPLRDDPRLRLLERTNARTLAPASLLAEYALLRAGIPVAPPQPDFFAMDVSFIGASLVLPAVVSALSAPERPFQGEAVILVKPQFEAGREWVGKGGIVRDPEAHRIAIDRVRSTVVDLGAQHTDITESPITGTEGNREFLLYARFHAGTNGEPSDP